MQSGTGQVTTGFEELVAVGYSPERGRLEATVAVNRTRGYAGPTGAGSREYVRFHVDTGDGFFDAGLAAVLVTDADRVPGQREPARPLCYVVGVPFTPPHGPCEHPRLARVRAVLCWQAPPPAGDPEFRAERGDRRDGVVRLPARAPRVSDYLAYLGQRRVPLPAWHRQLADDELAVAAPAALRLDELIERYAGSPVPAHRFALPAVAAALQSGVDSTLWAAARQFSAAGLDWAATAVELFNANGDTSYERLTAVGLDLNTDSLVATVQVGRGYGYNGDPCTAGSGEYVAFWADWGDDGVFGYLGTASVAAHDLTVVPDGGLAYTVALELDPAALPTPYRDRPARIRAVLSWGTPPSVTDPYALPYWGDAREAWVCPRPGAAVDGPALTLLGGVPVPEIDPVTGLPRPEAGVRGTGLPPAGGRPLGGRLAVAGAGLRYRQLYRVMVRNLSRNAAATPVTAAFTGVDAAGRPTRVTPSADGWVQTVGVQPHATLAEFTPGDRGPDGAADGELWAVWLETQPPRPVTEHRVRLLPTAPLPDPSALPDPSTPDSALIPGGGPIPGGALNPGSGLVPVAAEGAAPTRRPTRRTYLVGHEYALVDRKPPRVPARRRPAEDAPADPVTAQKR